MSQKKKYILLKITDQGVFYNEKSCFKWSQTNFPNKSDFNWREGRIIYWRAEMLDFDPTIESLVLEVKDYNVADVSIFKNQSPKRNVNYIHFHNLSWAAIQAQLRSYVYKSFMHLEGTDVDERKVDPTILPVERNKTAAKEMNTVVNEFVVEEQIPLMEFTFKMGCVEKLKYFEQIDESVMIRVENDAILPQFDHIKPYFKKYFKNRLVDIKGFLKRLPNGEWSTRCRSSLIQRINEETIASIRQLVIKDKILQPSVIDIDKSLFTSEDIFLNEQDIDLGKALNVNDKNLIKEILDLKGVRNRKQLIYLSGKIQESSVPIRFTLAPQFGFLFHHQGTAYHHFIWELLNSNATYLWSISREERGVKYCIDEVERIINFIRSNGRRAYLSDSSHNDFSFQRIQHKFATSKLKDAFPLWKAKLEERLV